MTTMTTVFPFAFLPYVCDSRGWDMAFANLMGPSVGCEPHPSMEAVPALSAFLRGDTNEWPSGCAIGDWGACDDSGINLR